MTPSVKSVCGIRTWTTDPLVAGTVKSNGAEPSLGTMRNSAERPAFADPETTALKVMPSGARSVPMYPYGPENPQGSFGFPLSGAGEVPKFVGVDSVDCALAAWGPGKHLRRQWRRLQVSGRWQL